MTKHTKDINSLIDDIISDKRQYNTFDDILDHLVDTTIKRSEIISNISLFNKDFQSKVDTTFSVEIYIGVVYDYTISNKLTSLLESVDLNSALKKLNKYIDGIKSMLIGEKEAYSKYIENYIKKDIDKIESLNTINHQSNKVCNDIIHSFVKDNLDSILQIHCENGFKDSIDIIIKLYNELDKTIKCNIQGNTDILSSDDIKNKINYIRECTDSGVKLVVIKSKNKKHHTGYYETAVRNETVVKIKTIDDNDYIMTYEYVKYRYFRSKLGDVNKEQYLVLKTSNDKYYIIDDEKISYDMTIIQNIKDDILDKICSNSVKLSKANLELVLRFFNIDAVESSNIIENYMSELKKSKLKI